MSEREAGLKLTTHECDTPFWRTPDSRWTCPTCRQEYEWKSYIGTIPGVPGSVCTVRVNKWERVN